MAIDLDKRHYNKYGEKIEGIREVRPENDSPEIYPQREIYPKGGTYGEYHAPAEQYPQMKVGEQTGVDNYQPQQNMPCRPDKNPALKIVIACMGATVLTMFIILSTVLSGLLGAVKSGITEGSEYTAVTESPITIDNFITYEFPAEDIGKIYVDIPYTYVTVTNDDNNYTGKIQLNINCEEEYGIRASAENGILNITSDLPMGAQGDFSYERFLSVYLPYNCESDISLGCNGGRISCSGLKGGSLDINNSDCDISVFNSLPESVYVKTYGDDNTLTLSNVASDRIKVSAHNDGCYMNMIAAHEAEITCETHLSFSDIYVDRSTVLLANNAYIMNNVLSGTTYITTTEDVNIVSCDIKGGFKAESLAGGVYLTDSITEDTLLLASSPDMSKGRVRARLCGDGSSFDINENRSEEFVSEIEKQIPKSETNGKYAVYARTRGGDIRIDFSDVSPDTASALSFAERFGYYER